VDGRPNVQSPGSVAVDQQKQMKLDTTVRELALANPLVFHSVSHAIPLTVNRPMKAESQYFWSRFPPRHLSRPSPPVRKLAEYSSSNVRYIAFPCFGSVGDERAILRLPSDHLLRRSQRGWLSIYTLRKRHAKFSPPLSILDFCILFSPPCRWILFKILLPHTLCLTHVILKC
jgi:hypothetical protein